jgi:putative flippase GtrA
VQADPANQHETRSVPAQVAGDLTRVIKFAAVGVANTFTDLGLYTAAVIIFGWHPLIANTLSYSSGVLCSFVLNRTWTFADCDRSRPAQQLLRFIGVNALTLSAGNVIIAALLTMMPAIAAKGIAVVLGFVLNYGFSRRFVFAR